MTAAPKTRFFVEETGAAGSWNMAVDEHLLLRAINKNESTVRIYSWESPTVSLGYFQDSTEFLTSGHFPSLPVVRRLSGGGAILHDCEITYSIAVPPEHPLLADPVRLYEAAHAGIIETLKDSGVHLAPRGENLNQDLEPFLCFSRGNRNDLLLSGVKVVGSAQRRRKGAVLQHGSILLGASPYAEKLPGIRNLAPSFQPDSDFQRAIGEAIFRRIEWPGPAHISQSDARRPPEILDFTESELLEIRTIEESHYRHIDQLRSRSTGHLQ